MESPDIKQKECPVCYETMRQAIDFAGECFYICESCGEEKTGSQALQFRPGKETGVF